MEKRDLLIQIDKAITALNSKNIKIDSILDLCSSYLDVAKELFFSGSLVIQQKEFLTAVLVRVCGINENLLWHLPERYKVFLLIKEVLEPNFRYLGITDKDLKDNSTFLRKIREIEYNFNEECDKFEKNIVNLHSLAKFPTNLLKFINSKKFNFIFNSFCDLNLYTSDTINKLFENSSNLLSDNVNDRIKTQKKLIKSISTYLADIKKSDITSIETLTIVAYLQKSIDILQDNLPEEHKIRIANLSIEEIERKYPLNKVNEFFEIKFKIVNDGGGDAQNTLVKIKSKHQSLIIPSEEIHVGEIETHTEIVFKASCNEIIEEEKIFIEIEVFWNDFEGNNKKSITEIPLLKQNSDINWNTQKNPYSLDAIKGKDDFIGRKELIKSILSNYEKETFESSIITGQKRVGKSSVGRAIESMLNERDHYTVIYISVNDLDNQRPETFVNSFGDMVFTELKYQLEKIGYKLSDIKFEGSLYPLLKILGQIKKDMSLRKSEHKIIIIVDEFDEIPIQMINDTEIGNGFFQNIRSLIDKREYTELLGIILIGGENMKFINQNTQRFNKFNLHSVDYFDKEKYWTDFAELVTKPAKDIIEYSSELLNQLYELTEGNPFYTNLLCKQLFDYGLTNKISYLTESHLEKILSEKLIEMGTLHFSHFWLDYILEADKIKKDNLETQRRKLLIAYSQLKRENKQVSEKNFSSMKILENVSIPKTLESFINRGVFVPVGLQDYRFKPRFAEKWLIEIGSNELISSFTNEEAVQMYAKKENELYISDKEIQSFIENKKISAYRSRPIEISHIRNWLSQFDDNQERRRIFKLLSKIKYYDEFEIREKIKLIHRNISKKLPSNTIILGTDDTSKKDRQRKDIIISGFDKLGKSTPLYARIYRQENDINLKNLVISTKLKNSISSGQKINAIVFIDDIIGSGGTIIKEMKTINTEIGKSLKNSNIKVYITSITGLDKGIQNIYESLKSIDFDFEVYCPDVIPENETCIAEDSIFYDDIIEREKTIEIIKKYHQKLNLQSEEFTPFGYNNDGLLVAFNEACPNNTLPLIWKTEEGKWNALLKR